MLAPASSKASRLLSKASRNKGWFGGSKVSRPARGTPRCATYLSGEGGANAHVGFGVGVKSGVLIKGGYRNRLYFRPTESAGLSASRPVGRTFPDFQPAKSANQKCSGSFWAKSCALGLTRCFGRPKVPRANTCAKTKVRFTPAKVGAHTRNT